MGRRYGNASIPYTTNMMCIGEASQHPSTDLTAIHANLAIRASIESDLRAEYQGNFQQILRGMEQIVEDFNKRFDVEIADKERLRARLELTENDLVTTEQTLQSQLESTEKKLKETKTELKETKTELKETKTELKTTQKKLYTLQKEHNTLERRIGPNAMTHNKIKVEKIEKQMKEVSLSRSGIPPPHSHADSYFRSCLSWPTSPVNPTFQEEMRAFVERNADKGSLFREAPPIPEGDDEVTLGDDDGEGLQIIQ
ncbi:hypothetical protein GE09DRAFT_1227425 [Coniochaeta sp. 2T2.1]|nr:hypothetical protein GE09DRAFT_1227425 [Coniochaeta sp. 2T2.1]